MQNVRNVPSAPKKLQIKRVLPAKMRHLDFDEDGKCPHAPRKHIRWHVVQNQNVACTLFDDERYEIDLIDMKNYGDDEYTVRNADGDNADKWTTTCCPESGKRS